jgi:hypothetical protein
MAFTLPSDETPEEKEAEVIATPDGVNSNYPGEEGKPVT